MKKAVSPGLPTFHSSGHAIFSRPIDSFPRAFQFQASYLQSEVKVNSPSYSQGPGLDCRLERWGLRTFSDVHLVSRRIIRRAVQTQRNVSERRWLLRGLTSLQVTGKEGKPTRRQLIQKEPNHSLLRHQFPTPVT
jgi:hypothetical protein